ncbi:MAG: TIGR02757 family protein [Bacteroidetes bacterium]|nr:TIGR02757 family protein [Bacteroidota bacterium]
MNPAELKDFLDAKVLQYNCESFIKNDPISIPHLFSKKEDVEIAGFFTATISWGQRPVIVRNAKKLMELMDMDPFRFTMNSSAKEMKRLGQFTHRTFNCTDAQFFILALRNIYRKHGGLENCFRKKNRKEAIIHFRNIFFSVKHPSRSEKHISDPGKNSSAKRINMFLRWMVRKDKTGVDFGIWKNISPAHLCVPLDVHVGNTARALGLLTRKQNDWKSVEELTAKLREFDPKDPVKYDFALFGLGINENFS